MKIKFFIYLIICIIINLNAGIKFHSFFPELHEDYRAEYIIYKLLKKKPINKEIDFVSAPWFFLQKNILDNKKPNIYDLANLKFKNAFTICSFDSYKRLIHFFKSIGIKVVFSAAGHENNRSGIEIVTIPYFARNSVKPAEKKDIFYSFIGNIKCHGTRQSIIRMAHPRNAVIIGRDHFHYNMKDKFLLKKMEQEYAKVLSRSRFSLCPRGRSPGTYRFWESLQAGSIPVLISDSYQLPIGFDWNSCIIRIKENEIEQIPSILLRISKEKEQEMRKNCLAAYSLYSGKKMDRVIRKYFKNKK